MPMAMTHAKTGRSKKNLDIVAYFPDAACGDVAVPVAVASAL